MEENKAKIDCIIFQKQEIVIKDITDKINQAIGVHEKAGFAKELQKEVDVLLNCLGYEESMLNCKHCRFIANFRKNTANIVIKAEKLV